MKQVREGREGGVLVCVHLDGVASGWGGGITAVALGGSLLRGRGLLFAGRWGLYLGLGLVQYATYKAVKRLQQKQNTKYIIDDISDCRARMCTFIAFKFHT